MSSRTKHLCINQSWREIATTTPQLWIHLHIHTDNASPAQFYLKESGILPLDVQIKLLEFSVTDKTALTEVLAEHLSRIRLLEIHIQEHKCAGKLIAQLGLGQSAPIPELLCIQIDSQLCESVPSYASLHFAFRSTPRLARLSLQAYLPNKICPLFFSSALTDLTLDTTPFGANLDGRMIFATIKALKNLQSFTFKSSDNFSFCDPSTFPSIDTPHLISVDISAPGWGLDILSNLHAPLPTRFASTGSANTAFAPGYPSTPNPFRRRFDSYPRGRLSSSSSSSVGLGFTSRKRVAGGYLGWRFH